MYIYILYPGQYIHPSIGRMTCPARKDEADWLVELTGQAGNTYRADIESAGGSILRAPVTATEFHSRWRESEGGKAIDQARYTRRSHILLHTYMCSPT